MIASQLVVCQLPMKIKANEDSNEPVRLCITGYLHQQPNKSPITPLLTSKHETKVIHTDFTSNCSLES